MKVTSPITGKEYEVKTFMMEEGAYGICHESYQHILENELGPEVTYDIEVLNATSGYCAVKCVIQDSNNRKVIGFNDVNTSRLVGRDSSQEQFTKAHPLITATQAAVDTAVRSYLKFPRVLSGNDSGSTTVSEEVALPPELADLDDYKGEEIATEPTSEIPAVESNNETVSEENNCEEFSGMNPPEKELDTAARLAELGSMKPPKGKYVDMTYDQIWEEKNSWFSYVLKNNKSDVYKDAREYATLKGMTI